MTMLNLVLFSASGRDETVLEFAARNANDQIVLHAVLSDVEAGGNLRNPHQFANHHIYEACHLTRTSPAVLSLLLLSLQKRAETVLVDVDFAEQHLQDLSGFLRVARRYDLFSLNGRFHLENKTYRFSFPSWELCYFSPKLWAEQECQNYLRYLRPPQRDDDVYYAVQYFYEHFRHQFACGSLIDDQPGTAFNLLEQADVDIGALIDMRLQSPKADNG